MYQLYFYDSLHTRTCRVLCHAIIGIDEEANSLRLICKTKYILILEICTIGNQNRPSLFIIRYLNRPILDIL